MAVMMLMSFCWCKSEPAHVVDWGSHACYVAVRRQNWSRSVWEVDRGRWAALDASIGIRRSLECRQKVVVEDDDMEMDWNCTRAFGESKRRR